MITLKLKLEINYNDGCSVKQKNIKEKFDDNVTLCEAIDYVYKKYRMCNSEYSGWYIVDFVNTLWNQYFSKKIENIFLITASEYFNTTLREYEIQFKISKKKFTIVLDPGGIGSTAGINKGIKFYFHTNEKDIHHVPHIHCRYQGVEWRVRIDTLEILDKVKKYSKKVKESLLFIKKNQKSYLKYWKKVVINGESIKMKTILENNASYDCNLENDNYVLDTLFSGSYY